MFDWIKSVINIVYSCGYLGIALMMFLYNLFPPIPSELIMPTSGFTANPVVVAPAKSLVSLTGISNIPQTSSLFYTTLGSGLWIGLLTYSGYAFLSQYQLVDKYLALVSKIVSGTKGKRAFGLWVFQSTPKRRIPQIAPARYRESGTARQ